MLNYVVENFGLYDQLELFIGSIPKVDSIRNCLNLVFFSQIKLEMPREYSDHFLSKQVCYHRV